MRFLRSQLIHLTKLQNVCMCTQLIHKTHLQSSTTKATGAEVDDFMKENSDEDDSDYSNQVLG